MIFHHKDFKLQSINSVTLHLSLKKNMKVQLKIKPIKIQIYLQQKFLEWFGHTTSEPNGFWKDFMINQLKLMFSKKCGFRSRNGSNMGELAEGGSVAVALAVGDRLQMTPSTWSVSSSLFLNIVWRLFGIVATFRIRREIQCLLYEEVHF